MAPDPCRDTEFAKFFNFGWARGITKPTHNWLQEKYRPEFNPGAISEPARRTEVIAKGQIAAAADIVQNLPMEIARAMKINDIVRGGMYVFRREGFFNQFSDEEKKQFLINWEKNGTTGNDKADFLFRFYDALYKAMEFAEKALGIKYEARDWYIYHGLKTDARKADFERWMRGGDPRFTHERKLPKWEDVFREGFEPASLNPERLMQMRLFQSAHAVKKINTLREMMEAGVAFRTDEENLDPLIKENWKRERSPNGENYFVAPDARKVLDVAWDTKGVFDEWHGGMWKLLRGIKSTTSGLTLALSFTHLKHVGKMALANSLAQLHHRLVKPEHRAEAFKDFFNTIAKGGITHSRVIDSLQGKISVEALSPEEKVDRQHLLWMGTHFGVDDETQMNFANNIARLMPGWTKGSHYVNQALNFGYHLATAEPIHRWMFGNIIPKQKGTAALMLRDQLLRNRPELADPANRLEFKRALTDIGKAVDTRFGQMFYDNLFWKKTYKDIGQTTLLSLGWQLSALRLGPGFIRDLWEVAKHRQDLPALHKADPMLVDRLIFTTYYAALNALEAGIMTYFLTGLNGDKDRTPHGWDYVFPRTGRYVQGVAQRISPVEFSREAATLWQHMQTEGYTHGIGTFVTNKLAPIVSSAVQAYNNANFYGQQIADPLDEPWKQGFDKLAYILQNSGVPIPIKIALQSTPLHPAAKTPEEFLKNVTSQDVILSAVFGMPPAPAWAQRTGFENRIHDTLRRQMMGQKGHEQMAGIQAQQDYRSAMLSGDSGAIARAYKEAIDAGVSDKTLTAQANNLHINPAQLSFKRINWHDQAKLLSQASPEELKEYLPYANQKALSAYYATHRPNP